MHYINVLASIPPYMIAIVIIEAIIMIGIAAFIVMDTVSQRKKLKIKEEEQKQKEEERRKQEERDKEIQIADMEKPTRVANEEELSQLEYLERRAEAEMKYTDCMVKQAKAKAILEKLNKGEEITPGENEFLSTYQENIEEEKPSAPFIKDKERGKTIPAILVKDEEPSSLEEKDKIKNFEEEKEEEHSFEEKKVENDFSDVKEEKEQEFFFETKRGEIDNSDEQEEKDTGFSFGGSAFNVEEEEEEDNSGFFYKKDDSEDEPMDDIPENEYEQGEVVEGEDEESKINEVDDGFFFNRKEKETVTEEKEFIDPTKDIDDGEAPEN